MDAPAAVVACFCSRNLVPFPTGAWSQPTVLRTRTIGLWPWFSEFVPVKDHKEIRAHSTRNGIMKQAQLSRALFRMKWYDFDQ